MILKVIFVLWKRSTDSCLVTQVLLDAMLNSNVQNLVFVGDAYANLPDEDNFGLSEDIHKGLPESSLLLDRYGEYRIKAELLAKSYVGKELRDGERTNIRFKALGRIFQAHFLRPTFVYGEGQTKLISALRTACELNNGSLPYSAGSSRGMLQFVCSYSSLMTHLLRSMPGI